MTCIRCVSSLSYLAQGVAEHRSRDQMRKGFRDAHKMALHRHKQPRVLKNFLHDIDTHVTHVLGERHKQQAREISADALNPCSK